MTLVKWEERNLRRDAGKLAAERCEITAWHPLV
ncbi:hypothetical protein GGE09_000804 [Roseobacter sp. N2S]|nr:hypothetical protein [Roseobacter sp. N2S]